MASAAAKAGAAVLTLLVIGALAVSIATLVKVYKKDNSDEVSINVSPVVITVTPKNVANIYKRPVDNSQAYQDAAKYFANSIDTSVNPCDNFYQYACGKYNSTISFDVVDTNNYNIMASAFVKNDPKDPIPVQQVKTMFNQCVKDHQNWTNLVKDGYIVRNAVNAFQKKTKFNFPLFDKTTNKLPNSNDLSTALGFLSGIFGIDTLITPYVDTNWRDPQGNMSYLLFIDQSTLTLDWTFYIGSAWDLAKASLTQRITHYFQQYAIITNSTVNSDDIKNAVNDILNFEFMIANNYSTNATTRWNFARSYHLTNINSFNYPFINITNYLTELTSSSTQASSVITKSYFDFSLAEPGQLQNLNNAFSNNFNNNINPNTLYNYLIYRIIDSYSGYLPVQKQKNSYLDRFIRHKPTHGRPSFIRNPNTRITSEDNSEAIKLTCVSNTVFSALQYANARVFIDQIYPTNQSRIAIRKSIQKVVDGILIGMQSMIDQIDWMTLNSKQGAYAKIKNLVKNYAYPDFITDDGRITQYYKNLKNFTGMNYYQIQNAILQFTIQQQYDMLSKNRGVDRKDFNGPPGTVNAWYQPELNSITFPAAILQKPFFDPDWPASINYGALGVIAGHELTHSFDSSGTQWNGIGQLLGWLDDSSQISFNKMADCVINEYNNFCPLKNTSYTPSCINGQQTVGENVADNGGIHSAYRAYRNDINFAGSDPLLPGDLISTFTHDQLFFLSFAQVWCQTPPSNDALYEQLMVDPHSPSKYRVFGTLQNYPGFRNAFNCPLGSTYAPKNHCSVWISDVNITTQPEAPQVNQLNIPPAPLMKADDPLYNKYNDAQSFFKNTINFTADPCNDFYNYACGSTRNPVSFTVYRNKNYQMMVNEYEKILADGYNGDLTNSKAINKTMQYYQTCKTTNANINAQIKDGKFIQSVIDDFSKYTGLKFTWFNDDSNTLTPEILAKAIAYLSIKHSVDTLVTPIVDVNPTFENEFKKFKAFVLYFDQNTAFYLKSYYQDGAWNITYPKYLNNSMSLLKDFSLSRNKSIDENKLQYNIEKMLEFERTIATAPYSANDTIRRIYKRWLNPMKVSDISYKFIDWNVFTQALNDLSGVNFIGKNSSVSDYYISITEVDALNQLSKDFANFDQEIIVKYLYYRLIAQYQAFVYKGDKTYLRLYPEDGITGNIGRRVPIPDPFEPKVTVDKSVMVNCVVETLNLMQYANARIFTELLYPNTDSQTKIRNETNKVITAIRNAMQNMLDDLTWLDKKSQDAARNKIQQLQLNLAYPDFILNNTLLDNYYATLNFEQSDDYFTMMQKLTVFNRYQMYLNLTQTVINRNDFLGPPGTVNAWYQPELNSITIPEGILQQPYFDANWPSSIKFGALGVIVGHELGHGFDDEGVQWDGVGRLNRWMTNSSYDSFLEMAKCVIDEYSSFKPLNDSYSPNHLNGENTQGENVADNGGIHSGWKAYRNWIALNGPDAQLPDPKFGKFTHDQLFFLSFAQVWCQTPSTPEQIYKQILVDPHSPSYYRVFGTIQNFPAFRTAFNCPVGSKYAPQNHCHVWVP